MTTAMKHLQINLKDRGYDPKGVDGYAGNDTAAAFQQLMTDLGLHFSVRGTGAGFALTAVQPVATPIRSDVPWMDKVSDVMGLHEVRDNAKLREWLKSDGSTVGDPAKISWCADLTQTAIRLSLPGEPFTGRVGENPYLAFNWREFGKECSPCYGALLTFWTTKPTSIYGHIGFYVGETATHYVVAGGNQSNSVSVTKIAKGQLRKGGCRWPLTAKTAPNTGPILMSANDIKTASALT